jgi:hypothetical protein
MTTSTAPATPPVAPAVPSFDHGANVGYLRPGTRLFAAEPSLRMHDNLRRQADQAGIDLHLGPHGAETLPLPDRSVDEVVCPLVLCTVEDPAAWQLALVGQQERSGDLAGIRPY